jgi:hypothetical protein
VTKKKSFITSTPGHPNYTCTATTHNIPAITTPTLTTTTASTTTTTTTTTTRQDTKLYDVQKFKHCF